MPPTTVHEIKLQGQIDGLKDSIHRLITDITDRTWHSFIQQNHFVNVKSLIEKNRELLDLMEERLEALRELDGESE